MTRHLTEDDLVLHYYGETDPSSAADVAAHLSACRECRASLARLERLLAVVSAGADVDVPAGLERDTWRRLERDVVSRDAYAWRRVLGVPRLVWTAAAAGVLLVVWLAGQSWRDAATPSERPVDAGHLPRPALRERVLLSDLGEHFERSEMMLVELVNAADHAAADMRRERALAADLLSANRLYRRTAADMGERGVAAVLEDLERVLVDVAASPAASEEPVLEAVGRRAESQNLIFKMRVLSSRIEAVTPYRPDARSNSPAGMRDGD